MDVRSCRDRFEKRSVAALVSLGKGQRTADIIFSYNKTLTLLNCITESLEAGALSSIGKYISTLIKEERSYL